MVLMWGMGDPFKSTNVLVKCVKTDVGHICLLGPAQGHLGGDEVAENSRGKRS